MPKVSLEKMYDWAISADVDASAKLVLFVLIYFLTTKNKHSKSISSLGALAGLSGRSVIKHLASLEADGYISKTKQYDEHGFRQANDYKLNISQGRGGKS